MGQLVGCSVSPLISLPFLLYNRLEQKKNKDQNSNKRFALFTWSSFDHSSDDKRELIESRNRRERENAREIG